MYSPPDGNPNPDAFEAFKYGQQVSVAIWAGVALAVFAFVTSEHFKAPKDAKTSLTASAPARPPG